MKPPKVEMPKAQEVVPPPPPLTEELEGVEFGGQDKDKNEGSGRKSMTVKRGSIKNRMASKQSRGVVKRNSAIDNKSS